MRKEREKIADWQDKTGKTLLTTAVATIALGSLNKFVKKTHATEIRNENTKLYCNSIYPRLQQTEI